MKKFILSSLSAIVALFASAATLTPQQALDRIANHSGALKTATKDKPVLVHTVNARPDTPALYVFNNGNSGYMILSADDVAAPILAYSDSGSFTADNMPQSMAWWLNEYAVQISYAKSRALPPFKAPAQAQRQAIEPMLKTAWDQVEPFNNLCPLSGGNRTYTGCVATSVAQVMKYWEYPEVGQGSISYNDSNLGKRLTLDFSKRAFDWDLMLNNYTGSFTPEQADAVAYLMRAAAFSVKMNFSDQASSAYALNVADALVKYFKYDRGATYAVRSLYSPSQWDELIYNNLHEVGPVIYGGSSMMGGGHSFVCDGYDGNGYYHFNWGWSGMSNGYFLLDALTPSNLGAGGGTGGGYSFSQDAVLGIQPPTGAPAPERHYRIVQAGSLNASVSESVLTFQLSNEESATWLNYNPLKLSVTFGAIFQNRNSSAEPIYAPVGHKAVALNAGYGTTASFTPQINLADLNLADGTYKVTFATNIAEDPEAGWLPVEPFYGYSNYVTLTKLGNTYSVETVKPARLHVTDGKILNTIYYGGLVKVTATVTNDSDVELSCGLAPALFYTPEDATEPELYFLGASQLITVAPHTSVEHTWDSDFTPTKLIISMSHEAELQLTFFDENTYNYYKDDIYKPVVMYPNPGTPSLALKSISVPGGQMKLGKINGQPMAVWHVTDNLNIPVDITTNLSGTVPFCYQLIACLLGATPESDGSLAIYAYNGSPVFLNPGDPAHKLSTTLSYAYMQPGQEYLLTAAYLYGSSFVPVSNTVVGLIYDRPSGIESVTVDTLPDDDHNAPIYNIQGAFVGTNLNSLPAGIYIRSGKKILKQ